MIETKSIDLQVMNNWVAAYVRATEEMARYSNNAVYQAQTRGIQSGIRLLRDRILSDEFKLTVEKAQGAE